MSETRPARPVLVPLLVGACFALLLPACGGPGDRPGFTECDDEVEDCDDNRSNRDDDDGDEGAWPDPFFELDVEAKEGPDHTLEGEISGDLFAMGSIAALDDIDGDGIAEVVVTARGWDAITGSIAGRVYVFFSPAGVHEITLAEDADVIISGTRSNGLLGWKARALPDLDGDGLQELALSRPGSLTAVDDLVSGFMIFTGAQLADGLDLTDEDAHTFVAFEHDYVTNTPSPKDVAALGDLNGDGVSEIAFGVAGWDAPLEASHEDCASDAYPLNGSDRGAIMMFDGARIADGDTILLQDADAMIEGWRCHLDIGENLATAGDVDGDGLDDLLIGSQRLLDGDGSAAGGVYLWSGAELMEGDALVDEAMATFLGEPGSYGEMGGALTSLGDMDDDGLADFAFSAPLAPFVDVEDGQVFIVLGASVSAGGVATMPGGADIQITGSGREQFGSSLAAGDFDGDGILDLLIGARNTANVNVYGAGGAYLAPGERLIGALDQGGDVFSANDMPDKFVGTQANEFAGDNVAAMPDVDGDRLDEILITAPGWDKDDVPDLGHTYMLLSRFPDPEVPGDDDDDDDDDD